MYYHTQFCLNRMRENIEGEEKKSQEGRRGLKIREVTLKPER